MATGTDQAHENPDDTFASLSDKTPAKYGIIDEPISDRNQVALQSGGLSSGVSNELFLGHKQDCTQLQANLFDAKKEYFTAKILYDAIVSATLSNDKCSAMTDDRFPDRGTPIQDSIERTFYTESAMSLLEEADLKGKFSALGIKKNSIDSYLSESHPRMPKNFDKSTSSSTEFHQLESTEKKAFEKKVMKSLKKYDQLIFNQHGDKYCSLDEKFVRNVKTRIDDVTHLQVRIERNQGTIDNQVTAYSDALLTAICNLQEMMTLQRKELNLKPKKFKMFVLKFRALNLKLSILQNEILTAAYTKDVVKCHEDIKLKLDDEKEKLKFIINAGEKKRQLYHNLGDEYADIVKEFQEIQKKIKSEKWAIAELQNEED